MPRRAAFLVFLGVCACSREPVVQPGSRVRMHYSVLIDGRVVEGRGENTGPWEFTQGAGEVLPGVDAAVLGLKAGEERALDIPAESAYGLRDPGGVRRVVRSAFGGMDLEPGMKIDGMQHGRARSATVVAVGSAAVTLDFNHPRAGKAVRVRFKILEVR